MQRPWLLLLAALALGLARPAAAEDQRLPLRFTLAADQAEYDLTTGRALARGHALLSFRDAELRADSIEADTVTGQLQAYGGITLTQADRILQAEAAEYNLQTRRGVMLQATAAAGPARFTGQRLEVTPTRMSIDQATFTTCDRPRPDYLLKARRIVYYPDQRVTARHASLYLYGHRVLSLPSLSRSLRRGDRVAPGISPHSGWSRRDGAFLGLIYGFAPGGAQVAASADVRYTQHRGPRGLALLNYLPGWAVVSLAGSYREDLAESPSTYALEPLPPRIRRVLVDRAPELSVQVRRGSLLPWLKGEFWAAVGAYRERPSGASGRRSSLAADVETDPWHLSPSLSLSAGAGWRQALYAAGLDQRVLAPRVGARVLAGKGFGLGLTYQHRTASGRTPFSFDEVEISRELSGNLMLVPHPGWRTQFVTRYDTGRHALPDAGITVTRVLHCLEYSLGWRKSGGQIRLGVDLAGEGGELLRNPSRLQGSGL